MGGREGNPWWNDCFSWGRGEHKYLATVLFNGGISSIPTQKWQQAQLLCEYSSRGVLFLRPDPDPDPRLSGMNMNVSSGPSPLHGADAQKKKKKREERASLQYIIDVCTYSAFFNTSTTPTSPNLAHYHGQSPWAIEHKKKRPTETVCGISYHV